MTTGWGNTALGSTAPGKTATVQPTLTAAPKKRGWMPLLTILFLISYALMTLLIVEQGLTIENQRALIRDLFRDSAELSALKGKAVQENNKQLSGQAKSPTHDPALPSNQSPSKQVPSNEVPPNQVPSDSVRQHRAQTQGSAQKPRIQGPSRPASDLADERRSVITI